MSGLPRPIDANQEYLAAILAELRAIRELLEQGSPQPTAPKQTRRKRTEATE